MSKVKSEQNGHGRLEEAMALLIHNQATLVQTQAAFTAEHFELERRHLGLKTQIDEIIRVLNQHGQLIERLTQAVREKIGFKADPKA
jgi:hypothetical protein